MSNSLAPIVLFVYNRLEHTKRTIEALRKNFLADASNLIIISDHARSEEQQLNVREVRNYIKNVSGFKEVSIIERASNYGLARNIIEGVTEVISKYGKIIVLEDDIVTSPSFLNYMNGALTRYENEKKVWHISGWSYPFDKSGLEDFYFSRMMICWGWATWSDRWCHFKKSPDELVTFMNKSNISKFNLDDSFDLWSHVLANLEGKSNTWAIFWYASIFRENKLCLMPKNSFVDNIGLDGSGTNSNKDAGTFKNNLKSNTIYKFPESVTESSETYLKIKDFYKRSNLSRIKRILKKLPLQIFKKE